MNSKLLIMTEHHLEFLSLKGGYTGLSESIHVKMPHCWKSRVAAHICPTSEVYQVLGTVVFVVIYLQHQHSGMVGCPKFTPYDVNRALKTLQEMHNNKMSQC